MATRAAAYKVLLIDAGLSATLPVIRALHTDGAEVRLAVAESAIGAARLAGGCAAHVRYPPLEEADAGFERLLAFIRHHGIDVVLPLSDAATAALDRLRARLERHVALAIPPAAAVADTMDKGRTLAVARRVPETFAVPATLEPEGPHAVDPAQVRSWPVLVKPRDADGARGIHLVTEAQSLRDVYAAVDRTFPRPLIQELIPYRPGEKYQLYYLFDAAGVPCARFMQQILEEASGIAGPDGTQRRGGISLLWESALDEDLLARGQRLLATMGWRGTAFVEVVRDRRDGVVKLLEINPRLSGSIHLCLAVGPNLAAGACRVALGLPVAAEWDFAVGRRARRDLSHLVTARAWRLMLDRGNLPPYRLLADPLPVAAASMGRLGRGIGSSASAG